MSYLSFVRLITEVPWERIAAMTGEMHILIHAAGLDFESSPLRLSQMQSRYAEVINTFAQVKCLCHCRGSKQS